MQKLTTAQRETLVILAATGRAIWEGEYVHLTVVRNLAALGFVTLNEFKGRHEQARRVTKWNARITDAGRAALAEVSQ